MQQIELTYSSNLLQTKLCVLLKYADVFRNLGFSLILEDIILKKRLPNKSVLLNSILDNKIIGIAPFAAHRGKMYPLEKMEKVICSEGP